MFRSIKDKVTPFIGLILFVNHTFAQLSAVNSGDLVIHDGADVSFFGDFLNTGQLTNSSNVFSFRDWENTGNSLIGTGTVHMIGSTNQEISGETYFYNINVDNMADVDVVSGQNYIIRSMDIDNGVFSTNDALTVLSNDTLTGWIDEINNGAVSGHITMQRYIDAGATQWRFLASATENTDLEQYDDDFITSGVIGSDWPGWIPPGWSNVFYSLQYYDETVPGAEDEGFLFPPDMNYIPQVGQGMWIWCGDTITGTDPFTIDHTEEANQGDINLPVSYTYSGNLLGDGWNMVGNPYPCPINWDSPFWTKTNINGAIYIWNPDLATYASYVSGIGVNGGSASIASSQAFWVKAGGFSPQLTIREQCKDPNNTAFIKASSGSAKMLRLKISNGTTSDEVVLRFQNGTTPNYEANLDAYKIYNEYDLQIPQMGILDSVKDYSISTTADDLEQEMILKVRGPYAQPMILSVEEMTNFNNECITITDLHTGQTYPLDSAMNYNFNSSSTTLANRFQLNYAPKTAVSSIGERCKYSNDGAIEFNLNSNTLSEVWATNASGDTLFFESGVDAPVQIQNLSSGTYYLYSSHEGCSSVIQDTVLIEEPVDLKVGLMADTSFNTIFSSVSGGTPPYQYAWSTGDTTEHLANVTEGSYQLTVSDFFGCNRWSFITVEEEVEPNNDVISVYPNPFNDRVIVSTIEEDVQIHLYNNLGQELTVQINPAADGYWLDTKSLAAGKYFLVVNSAREVNMYPLVKL